MLDTVDLGRGVSAVLSRDLSSGVSELEIRDHHGGCRRLSDGFEYEPRRRDLFTIVEEDPLSATVRCERVVRIARGDWQTRVETASKMSSDRESFTVTNALEAFEGNIRVFSKVWVFTVPRNLV